MKIINTKKKLKDDFDYYLELMSVYPKIDQHTLKILKELDISEMNSINVRDYLEKLGRPYNLISELICAECGDINCEYLMEFDYPDDTYLCKKCAVNIVEEFENETNQN